MNKQTLTQKKETIKNMVISLTRTRRLLSIILIGVIQLVITQGAMIFFMQGFGQGQPGSGEAVTADSLRQIRNKLGEQITTTRLLNMERDQLLQLNALKDTTIMRLQSILKEQKTAFSATWLRTETATTGATQTQITFPTDSINTDSIAYPEYRANYSDHWRTVEISARRDSVHWDIRSFNEFEIVQKYERQGLFKPKLAVVEVKNKNPYTETKGLQSFTLKPPRQRRGLFFIAGAALGALTYSLLQH